MHLTAFSILLSSLSFTSLVQATPGLFGSTGSYDLERARQQQSPPVEQVERLPPPYSGPKPETAQPPPPYFPAPDPNDLPPPILGEPPRMEAGAERPPLYTPPNGKEPLPRKDVGDRLGYPFYDQLPPHVSQETRNRPPAWDRIYSTVPVRGDGRARAHGMVVPGQDSPPRAFTPRRGFPFSRSGSAGSLHDSVSGGSASGHETVASGQEGRPQQPARNGNPSAQASPQSSSSRSSGSGSGRRLIKLPFCSGGRTGSHNLAKRGPLSCIWPDDPRIVENTRSGTGAEIETESSNEPRLKDVKAEAKSGTTATETTLQAEGKGPVGKDTKHLVKLAEEFSETEFSNLARKAGHAAIVERRWGKSLSEIRTKALRYVGISPPSSKSAVLRVQKNVLTTIGYVVWIEQMVMAFATETSDWDKAAAVTLIIPFVGCGVGTYAKVEKNKEDVGALLAVDAGLCLLGDALLLGGSTAPFGILVHFVRFLIQLFEPPPRLPSLQAILKMREKPWRNFLDQHLTEFLTSKAWRDKLEGAVAIEALAIWSKAADVVGLLEASRQFQLNDSIPDFQMRKREERQEKPTRLPDPEEAITEVRNKAAAEVVRRQRQGLLSLPVMLRDSFGASIKKTAEFYNREFIRKLTSEDTLRKFPSDAPISAWTRGDALYQPAYQFFELASEYLWQRPPLLPSLFTLAYFVGVSAGVDDPPPARVVHGDMPGFAKFAAAEKDEWTRAVDAAVIDPMCYYRENTDRGEEDWAFIVRHTLAVARHLEGKLPESKLPDDAPQGKFDLNEFHMLLAMHIGNTFANWKEARGSKVGYIHEDYEKDEAGLINRLYPITRLEAERLISSELTAVDSSALTPYSDPEANCRDALKLLAIAIGTGRTVLGGPAISLPVRPTTMTCPRIQGETPSPAHPGKGYWPSCRYSLPPASPKVRKWWSELVRSMPSAYSKIRRGGLDLESLKGCAGLREVFVSGRVTSVNTDEEGQFALDIYGFGSPSLDWCRQSRAAAGIGRDDWYCAPRSLIDDLPAV
ncbi:hypothetical protein CP533_1165 [Ophiocordyceps camponoti-saundersi (nom. inval.)]|nr:hypothetical protein CP533_1165 [Ophiocordyceps camponoti-saundersi (nom. inval.)]